MLTVQNISNAPISLTLHHSVTLAVRVVPILVFQSVPIADEEYLGTLKLLNGKAQAGQIGIRGDIYPTNDVDQGVRPASLKYVDDILFSGSEMTKVVDVSDQIDDAQIMIWQLRHGVEPIACAIKPLTTTTVQIAATVNLPAGTYRLIGA